MAEESTTPDPLELAHVVTIEDGRTRRLQEYFDRYEALKPWGSRTRRR